jgi:hypothetical protein
MGAHSFGYARSKFSGYCGKWTGFGNAGFNELFYLNMINTAVKWSNLVNPRFM